MVKLIVLILLFLTSVLGNKKSLNGTISNSNVKTVPNPTGRFFPTVAGVVFRPVWGYIQNKINGMLNVKNANVYHEQNSGYFSNAPDSSKDESESYEEEDSESDSASDSEDSLEDSSSSSSSSSSSGEEITDTVYDMVYGSSSSSEENDSDIVSKKKPKRKIVQNIHPVVNNNTVNQVIAKPSSTRKPPCQDNKNVKIPKRQCQGGKVVAKPGVVAKPPCAQPQAKNVNKKVKVGPKRESRKPKISQVQSKQSWLGSWFDDEAEEIITTTTEDPGWFESMFLEETITTPKALSTPENSPGWFDGIFSYSETTTPTTTEYNWFELQDLETETPAPLNLDSPRKRLTYSGYQLLRAFPDNEYALQILRDLHDESQDSSLQWWSAPVLSTSGRSTDILVPPDMLPHVKEYLDEEGVVYDVAIRDMQKMMAFGNPKMTKQQRLILEGLQGHAFTWRRYHRYSEMTQYLQHLSLRFPDLVELETIGRSYEGRPLIVAKVSLPSNYTSTIDPRKHRKKQHRNKPAVWIDGGMHAREWIAPAVALWFLKALVEGTKGDGSNRDHDMLAAADWYILGVGNPDGYEYSHTKDRFWRKTRSKHAVADTARRGRSNIPVKRKTSRAGKFLMWPQFEWLVPRSWCIGVDPDHNFEHLWGELGASYNPCSDKYAGPRAFSEPETRAASEFIMKNKDRIKVFLTLHSYAQMWMVPWGSDHSSKSSRGHDKLMKMAHAAVSAIRDVGGTEYEVASEPELHPSPGGAVDWAKSVAGIRYGYTVKLRDRGAHGFLLPPEQIESTAKETWAAITAIVENL